MCEAGLAELFVLRPHVVPGVDGDDRRLVIFMDDDGEAVIEDKLLVGNFNVRALRRSAPRHRNEGQGQHRYFNLHVKSP